MLKRFIYISIIIFLIALTVGFVLLNPNQNTVFLAPEWPVTGVSGVLMLCAFGLGILFTSLFATLFGIRAYFREQKLKRLDKKHKQFYEQMLEARKKSVQGEYKRAVELWEGLARKDPTDVIARVELARSLDALDKTTDALRIIDTARAEHPNSVEILLEAARLQIKLGNRTAAIDNLALTMGLETTPFAARMARDLSFDLQRFEDAREYNERLDSVDRETKEYQKKSGDIEFAILSRDISPEEKDADLKVRSFIKKNPENISARLFLAKILCQQGNIEEAAAEFATLYRATKEISFARDAVYLFIQCHQRDKALSFMQSIRTLLVGKPRIEVELEYIRTLLRLSQETEAIQVLEKFPELVKIERAEDDAWVFMHTILLRALAVQRLQDTREAMRLFKEIENFELGPANQRAGQVKYSSVPSPSLHQALVYSGS